MWETCKSAGLWTGAGSVWTGRPNPDGTLGLSMRFLSAVHGTAQVFHKPTAQKGRRSAGLEKRDKRTVPLSQKVTKEPSPCHVPLSRKCDNFTPTTAPALPQTHPARPSSRMAGGAGTRSSAHPERRKKLPPCCRRCRQAYPYHRRARCPYG